ncbi:MAG: polyphosphate polymerase domain-containing protein [Bacteroidales bacterium]|nr:polyphosphate polymerase domain-containing protein [Bacteroidales bacterium]
MNEIGSILDSMTTISLEEMKVVKLMNRVDTKYVFHKSQLPPLLQAMAGDYYVQSIEGCLIPKYKTLYYDTPDCLMYIQHHDKKLARQKLRTRCYLLTNQFFCEIKTKSNKGRTKKKRIEIDESGYSDIFVNQETVDFVSRYLRFDVNGFIPQLENNFERITLVNMAKTERMTIDMNILFKNHVTGQAVRVPDLVILELKQDGRCVSQGKRVLFNQRIKPCGMSKYCIGTVLTNPNVKINRFKKKLRLMRKLNIDIVKCIENE